jgi:hypothetical protein
MINNVLLDHGLLALNKTTRLLLLTDDVDSYTVARDQAIAEQTLPIIHGPTDASPSGRRMTVNEITDGVIKVAGTAAFYALVDDNAERLLATGPLLSPKPVAVGNAFQLDAFDITFPGLATVVAPIKRRIGK